MTFMQGAHCWNKTSFFKTVEKRINFFELYTSKLSKRIDFKYALEFLLLDFLATEKRRGDQFTEATAQEIISKSMALDKDSSCPSRYSLVPFIDSIMDSIAENCAR